MSSPVRTSPARRRAPAARSHAVLASMQRRIGGAAIDMALLIFVSGVAASLLERLTAGVTRIRIDAASGQRSIESAISLPLWLPLALLVVFTAAYTVCLMAIWGRTLGGWAVGIRCIRVDTGGRPGWMLASRRWFMLYGAAGMLAFAPVVGPFAWVLILVIGLSPLWDSTRRLRGYADHFGRDVVVMAQAASAGTGTHRR